MKDQDKTAEEQFQKGCAQVEKAMTLLIGGLDKMRRSKYLGKEDLNTRAGFSDVDGDARKLHGKMLKVCASSNGVIQPQSST